MRHDQIRRDWGELLFRVLFSSIFIGLGGEHIVSDDLIQNLMPPWVPAPRLFSVGAGVILLTGGTMVLVGWRLKQAAWILGIFLVVVTATVHLPGVLLSPPPMPEETAWMWTVLQRSNLVKNLCLLGVCILLRDHQPGRYSLDVRFAEAAPPAPAANREGQQA
ncbi:MAG: DoxX family protein [Myxococcota bacterium]